MARVSLNLATIALTPFPRQLQVARETGFAGVGLWFTQLERMLAAGAATLPTVASALRQQNLAVAELCNVKGWMFTQDRRAQAAALERVKGASRLAEFLGARCLVAVAANTSGSLEAAASDFREVCQAAKPFGCRVGLEWDGHGETVRDLATAWEVVSRADMPNGGLVVDTFHFFLGRSHVSTLADIPADRIYLVQVSDCVDLPPSQLSDADRVLPGSGSIPLPGIIAALHGIGYNGWWSLELHNEQYWREQPFLVAQDGWNALRRLDIIR